jgi:uncharacterized membrane protein
LSAACAACSPDVGLREVCEDGAAMAGPVALYLLVAIACGLLAMPACRLVIGEVRRVPLFSVSLTAGLPVALLVFSLVARAVPSYAIAVPLTFLLLGSLWAICRAQLRSHARAAWDRRTDALIVGVYAALLVALFWVRGGWPSVFWEHDFAHVGSEKLFNFSLIQAFLFGRGYPPENLWLAGEPVDYYVLLHALPGMAAWGWRVITGDATAAGVLFLFSDVFLLLFGSFALTAWSCALLPRDDSRFTRRQVATLGLALGIGVLLSTHGKAVRMVLAALLGGAAPGWWELEREVVPYTYSQYPFFLLLQGDHHAFQRVFFLQVTLYGAMVLLLGSSRLHWPRALLVGALAAAVQLAHSGSVLLDVVVFGLAVTGVLGVLIWQRRTEATRALAANLGIAAAVAAVLSLPTLWQRNSPRVSWYWVERGIASPLLEFMSAQAGPLVFFVAALAAGLWYARGRPGVVGEKRVRWAGIACATAVTAVLLAVGRPGAAFVVACASAVLLLAPWRSSSGDDRAPLVILTAAGFAIWLLPELLVGDFAHRPVVEWKRWNLAMRFWLEGHYLLPFLALLAFAPALRAALANRAFSRSLGASGAAMAALWLTVHGYALSDRLARTPDVRGFDATAFVRREYPCDAAIIDYLRDRPGPVRLGELCGTAESIPQVPLDYGWAGRIAALSGRPGICGWTRHVWQFSQRLRRGPAAGEWTWPLFRSYEQNMRDAFVAAARYGTAPQASEFLRGLGVTHVVLGVPESSLFPQATGAGLARALGGQVEYEAWSRCAVIRLQPADGTEPRP